MSCSTSPLVRDYIKKTFDVTNTDRGTLGLLTRLNFRGTRPTYTLAEADPAKQTTFRAEFAIIIQPLIDGPMDRILFEDESMIRDGTDVVSQEPTKTNTDGW